MEALREAEVAQIPQTLHPIDILFFGWLVLPFPCPQRLGPMHHSPSWSWAWDPVPRHPGSHLPAPSAWRGFVSPSRWTVATTFASGASARIVSLAASRPAALSVGRSASRRKASAAWGRR
jgi:hypothetical protein